MTPESWLNRVDPASFRRRLFRWYARFGRDFAWRRSSDLYAVWVSEVMLQQTTTTTVSRRFPGFLEQFPTIHALADASEESVLRAWEGLGYYRRARNLHRAARAIVNEHGGAIPDDPAVLRLLPGLGRYSANAILSFGKNVPLPILEANTIRVWARLCGVRGDVSRQPILAGLWTAAEALIPKRRGRDFNLALMDLGSLICSPRDPDCPKCPLRDDCLAFRSGRPDRYPLKKAKPATVAERRAVAVVRRADRVLLLQRGDAGRWAGMWEFPNEKLEPVDEAEESARVLASRFARVRGRGTQLSIVRHGIMHYRIEASPFYFTTLDRPRKASPGRRWATLAELTELPLSAAHRRIARSLTEFPVSEKRKAGRKL